MIKNGVYKKSYLEAKFIQFMNRYRLSIKDCEKFIGYVRKKLQSDQSDRAQSIEFRKRRLEEIEAKEKYLLERSYDQIIPDALLKRELASLEEERMKIADEKQEEPKPKAETEKMLGFVSEFLKNPGKAWANAPAPKKILLQWFEFPGGIQFDGTKFQTSETCFLFKLKNELQNLLSYEVHRKVITSNRLKVPSFGDIEIIMKKVEKILTQKCSNEQGLYRIRVPIKFK